MSNPPYALWLIWRELPYIPKLFLVILATAAIYSLVSATNILWHLRLLTASNPSHIQGRGESLVASLEARSANIRQLMANMFYLFGIVFFWGLQSTVDTFDSHIPVGLLVLNNFFLYFAFAFNAFLIFLAVHVLQWFVSVRVQVCRRILVSSPIF